MLLTVSHFCACIGSPCLRQCVHGAPIDAQDAGGCRRLRPLHDLPRAHAGGAGVSHSWVARADTTEIDLRCGRSVEAPSWHGTMCGARRVVNHSTARVVGQAFRRPSTQARLCDVDGLTQAQLAQHGGQLFMTIDSFCQRRGLTVRDRGGGSGAMTAASAPFPSWNRAILTEIYLCHACSDHVIEVGNGPPGAGARGGG